ncbi:MAG TPA: hypothetical protein VIU65_07955 [Pyrinomonadaceae bacterium]
MSRIIVLIASLAVTVVLLGCSKTEDTNANKTAPTSSTGTTSTTGTSTTASSSDKIGVPECDDFIAKYESCVSSKVPEMARAQYKSAVDQWRASWKKMADNPATKGSLAAACKQAADQQTAALKSFGCTF